MHFNTLRDVQNCRIIQGFLPDRFPHWPADSGVIISIPCSSSWASSLALADDFTKPRRVTSPKLPMKNFSYQANDLFQVRIDIGTISALGLDKEA